MDSAALSAWALVFSALTPVMLAVVAYFAARDARRAAVKVDIATTKTEVALSQIHTLVNDNLTKAKSRELIALEAWAMSMEANPEHDPEALRDLQERIEALKAEIVERDNTAATLEERP
jgi:hypothetical protein